MRRYQFSLSWIGAASLALGFVQGAVNHIDFGELHARIGFAFADTISYRSMTESQVAEVFSDRLPKAYRHKSRDLARHLIRLCRSQKFDPAFILALIHAESTFNVKAVSPRGAIGLMQLMPSTATWLAKKMSYGKVRRESLFDPYVNLSLGIAYLSDLRARYPHISGYYMLAAYNMGPNKLGALLTQANYRPSGEVERYVKVIRTSVESFRTYNKKVDARA